MFTKCYQSLLRLGTNLHTSQWQAKADVSVIKMLSPDRSAAVGSPPSIKKARLEAQKAHKRDFDLSPVRRPDFTAHVEDPFADARSRDLLKKLKW